MRTLLCVLVIGFPVLGQTSHSAVAAPQLGLVFDPQAGAVRALTGIPASSTLGDPLDGAAGLLQAAVSAEGRYAIGTDATTGDTVLISADGRRPVAGVGPNAARLVVSPRGGAAAIYFDSSRTVQVLTGLPASPAIAWTATLDGAPAALAVSDDGAALLAVLTTGRDGETVYAWRAGVAPVFVMQAHRVMALAFIPGRHDALLAEPNAVSLLPESAGPQVLAGEHDGIARVTGVAASADGSRVFIAMRSGRLAIRDFATGEQTVVSCNCAPEGLVRLRGNAVFGLNQPAAGPLWLLDADQAEPHVFFVAAGTAGSQ